MKLALTVYDDCKRNRMFLLRLAIFMDILDLREFIGHFKMSDRPGR